MIANILLIPVESIYVQTDIHLMSKTTDISHSADDEIQQIFALNHLNHMHICP